MREPNHNKGWRDLKWATPQLLRIAPSKLRCSFNEHLSLAYLVCCVTVDSFLQFTVSLHVKRAFRFNSRHNGFEGQFSEELSN